MRVELGAPIICVPGPYGETLWHVACPTKRIGRRFGVMKLATAIERCFAITWPTLCGLEGDLFAYGGAIRESRRSCGVCRARAPRDLVIPENGPLPSANGARAARAVELEAGGAAAPSAGARHAVAEASGFEPVTPASSTSLRLVEAA